MLVRLESVSDPLLDAYARLTEAQLRNKLEPEKGIFIAEAPKVIERALAGGMECQSLLLEEKMLESTARLSSLSVTNLRAARWGRFVGRRRDCWRTCLRERIVWRCWKTSRIIQTLEPLCALLPRLAWMPCW